MIPTRWVAGGLVCLALAAGAARAQPAAFDLVVRAPEPLRELLLRHLELGRYRQVSDLDDAELARLVLLAEKDARELLATQGYFAPQVRIVRETGPLPVLAVQVEPGTRTRVTQARIRFAGDIATTADPDAAAQRAAIQDDWALPAGQPFTQDQWDAAKARALRALQARRYPAGRISDSLADVDAATQEARLDVQLDAGPLFRLGPLRVAGLRHHDALLVQRLARLPEGQAYDQDQLVQAQLRLTASGYFDSAFLVVDPESDPAAAPVEATVREAPLQKVVLGLGFSTDGGPRASVEHTHNRVPGLGWRAVSKLQAERKNPYAQTELTAVPAADGWRWSVLARAERLEADALTTQAQRLRLGRFRSDDHIDRHLYLQLDRATVADASVARLLGADTGAGSAVTVNFVWTGRYFDSLPFPARGFGVGVEFGGGMTLGAHRQPFQRTQLRWLGLQPLAQGRLQWRAEAGAVLASDRATLPATQLFRTGGDTTVRGYDYLQIGVPLAGGLVGPGRYLAVGSAEWQRPLQRQGRPSDLESLLFVDAGAVADRPGELRPRAGAGAGVRWKSPIGPVEAALAYGFHARQFRLHFSAGFVF